jgi:hypothetical protein
MTKLSEDMMNLLRQLDNDIWLRPMDIGGHDGSRHSAMLLKLCNLDLACKMVRPSLTMRRPGYVYRRTSKGADRINVQADAAEATP